jgi:hypothetical protein
MFRKHGPPPLSGFCSHFGIKIPWHHLILHYADQQRGVEPTDSLTLLSTNQHQIIATAQYILIASVNTSAV